MGYNPFAFTVSSVPTTPTSTLSLTGGVLPVLYGRGKVPGKPVYLKVINNELHAIYLICEGEINMFTDILLNGKSYTAYTGGGIYIDLRTGTAGQTICGLSSYDAAWTYTLPDIAYIYLRLTKTTDFQDLPTVEGICEGRKLYDHRTGLTVYSNNPALVIADLITNTSYGGRIATAKIDWASVDAAANRCDESISGFKRFGFNYLFTSGNLQAAIDICRLHFLGTILEDNLYRLDYARPRNVSASFVESEIWNLKILPVPSQDMVNSVTWKWTDPTTWEQIDETLTDPALGANDELHELSYDLTGCQSLSQSKRIATFLLNHRLSDLVISFQTYNFKGLQVLDVVTLTHSLGLSAKQVYVTAIEPQSDESYIFSVREYDPAFFSDAVVTEPTYPDTTLPDHTAIPANASALILTEELMQLRDTTWISVIKMSWTASDHLYIKHYEVWAKQDAGAYVLLGTTTGLTHELRAAQELSDYTIKIIAVSLWDKKSTGITDNIIPQGKYLKPVWKQGAAITGTESGDVVFLRWYMPDGTKPAVDIDIQQYEIKRGLTTDTWETAIVVAHIDALVYNDSQAPTGTWRYFLKAEDSVFNYTDTALTCDIVVTLNPNIGFQQQRQMELTGSNLISAIVKRIASDGTDIGYPTNAYTWSQRFNTAKAWNDATQTYPITTFSQWMVPVPASGTIVTTAVDLSASLGGQWTLYFTAIKLGAGTASVAPKLLLSDDNINWTEYDASSIFSAKARYAKAKFVFSSSNTDTTYYIQEPVYMTLKADPKEDYGTAAVTAGSKAITFAAAFVAVKKITLTPAFGNDSLDPRQSSADALTTTGMTIKLFDKNNATAAGSVYWKVEGY